MVSKHNYSESSQDSLMQVAGELLHVLLLSDHAPYPWNPLEPESEAYLAELEQTFTWESWSTAEIAARSHSLFSQLDQLWPEKVPAAVSQTLQVSLSRRFAQRVPQDWLDAIANRATELLSTHLSLMDQLVQCVHQMLPAWAEDDLQVMARPLAYAMRGAEAEAIEFTLGAVRPLDWHELSEMERARLSLAIARYALAELETMGD